LFWGNAAPPNAGGALPPANDSKVDPPATIPNEGALLATEANPPKPDSILGAIGVAVGEPKAGAPPNKGEPPKVAEPPKAGLPPKAPG